MDRYYAVYNTPVFLGYVGEDEAREIAFDVSAWRETYGDGVIQLMARRPDENYMYPVHLTEDGKYVLWTVREADVAIHGQTGECELSFVSRDGVLVKSQIWQTYVYVALCADCSTPTAPEQSWLDAWRREVSAASGVVGQLQTSLQQAEESAGIAGTRAASASRSAETALSAATDARTSAGEAAAGAEAAAESASEAETSANASAASATESALSAEEAARSLAQSQDALTQTRDALAETQTLRDETGVYLSTVQTLHDEAVTAREDALEAELGAESAQARAEAAQAKAEEAMEEALAAREGIEESLTAAETAAQSADESARLAQSWAVGGTGLRPGEDTNNSKYYAKRAKNIVGGIDIVIGDTMPDIWPVLWFDTSGVIQPSDNEMLLLLGEWTEEAVIQAEVEGEVYAVENAVLNGEPTEDTYSFDVI